MCMAMEAAMERGQTAVGVHCRQFPVAGFHFHTQLFRNCVAHASRDKGRDRTSRGSGYGPGLASSAWLLPTSLVSERRTKDTSCVSDPDAPLTVYTIRFTTGISRGSALSEPYSAVNICLIGQNGTAALHRVNPINDPLESRAHAMEMCQLIGPDVGADCSLALADIDNYNREPGLGQHAQGQAPSTSGASSTSMPTSSHGYSSGLGNSGTNFVGQTPPPPPPKRRFLEGSVDEVSVLLPELGPLSGVLVGVEGGTWYLDEMDVSSSRTHHLDRFVCRRQLGGRVGEGAALLTSVPVGAVVYGEGEAAVILNKEQATALWSLNMSDYSDLKRRVAITTVLMVASGASLAALTGGTEAALPYAAGGVVGLVYQWLLMRGVDHVMETASGQDKQQQALMGLNSGGETAASCPEPRAGTKAASAANPTTSSTTSSKVLGSAPVRMGFICASAALGMALLSQEEAGLAGGNGAGMYGPGVAWQLALALLGFLTYKAALVGVSLGDNGSTSGGLGLRLRGNVMHSTNGGSRAQIKKYKQD